MIPLLETNWIPFVQNPYLLCEGYFLRGRNEGKEGDGMFHAGYQTIRKSKSKYPLWIRTRFANVTEEKRKEVNEQQKKSQSEIIIGGDYPNLPHSLNQFLFFRAQRSKN